jgi:hypothetical protein
MEANDAAAERRITRSSTKKNNKEEDNEVNTDERRSSTKEQKSPPLKKARLKKDEDEDDDDDEDEDDDDEEEDDEEEDDDEDNYEDEDEDEDEDDDEDNEYEDEEDDKDKDKDKDKGLAKLVKDAAAFQKRQEKQKGYKKKHYETVEKPRKAAAKAAAAKQKPRVTFPFTRDKHWEAKGALAQFVKKLTTTKAKKYNVKRWKQTLDQHLMLVERRESNYATEMGPNGPKAVGLSIRNTVTHTIVLKRWDSNFLGGIEYLDLFEVKKSQVPNANMGLYSKRPFKQGDVLGVFYGQVKSTKGKGKKKHVYSPYALEGTKHNIILEPKGGITTETPVYFGLHLANDPLLCTKSAKASTRSMAARKKHNFFVDEDFIAIACLDINIGDELFLFYGWGDDNEDTTCTCDGCKYKDQNYVMSPCG